MNYDFPSDLVIGMDKGSDEGWLPHDMLAVVVVRANVDESDETVIG